MVLKLRYLIIARGGNSRILNSPLRTSFNKKYKNFKTIVILSLKHSPKPNFKILKKSENC
jgi:hypothetical protein